MIRFTDLSGLAGDAVVLAAVVVGLPGIGRLPRLYRAALALAVIVLMLIPFGGFPAAAYLRGAVGDLSVTAVLLALLSIAASVSGRRLFDAGDDGILQFAVVCAALALYPMALGLGYFDPYRLGYGNPWFLGGLLAVALFCLYRRHALPALAIALSVLAWAAGWSESANLWDCLLDPLVALYAFAALLRRCAILLL